MFINGLPALVLPTLAFVVIGILVCALIDQHYKSKESSEPK